MSGQRPRESRAWRAPSGAQADCGQLLDRADLGAGELIALADEGGSGRDPGRPPVSIELRTASSPVVIEVSGGSVTTRLGTAVAPDLVLRGEPQLILALFSGQWTVAGVTDHGLEISGDASVLRRVLPPSHAA